MEQAEFESYIAQALDRLPEQFGRLLENVEVVCQVWPSPLDIHDGRVPRGSTLFGLYRGIPRTKRVNYTGVLPDKIIIFMGPILMVYGPDRERVKEQVYKTLIHEIGHHFGMSEEAIRKAQDK